MLFLILFVTYREERENVFNLMIQVLMIYH